jgi:excisionase family DNA binding protein
MGAPKKNPVALDANFMWARLLHESRKPQAPAETPRALTIPHAARYLSCSVKFVRSLIWKRELKYVKVGRRFIIDRHELDRWLNENQRMA